MSRVNRSASDPDIDWRREADLARRQLERTRESLLQSEQLASLGARVAGVAHEIHSPIGNSLTVASALRHKIDGVRQRLDEDGLRRSELVEFLDQVEEAARLLNRNLELAGDQIRNFKRVAVDQASARRRAFELHRVVFDVIETLRPQIRHGDFRVTVDIPEGIRMDSYPGALGQIITNCFNNALVHGFKGRDAGEFRVSARCEDNDRVQIDLADDGRGMDEASRNRAFERFFTTRGDEGGSGLGLSIVHDLATEVLKGRIDLQSRPGQGTVVHLSIPRNPRPARGEEVFDDDA